MASFTSIPAEILAVIFAYLQCFTDLTSVAGVCKEWRNTVRTRVLPQQQQEPRYPQLPWLLQRPLDLDAPSSTFSSFLSGSTRRMSLQEDVRRANRFCGSYAGGWIAAAADFQGPYALFNLIRQSSDSIPLPRELHLFAKRSQMLEIRMIILSDKPTAEDCMAAALTMGGIPSIVFCRPHVDRHWVAPSVMDTEPLQDSIYHRGEVYQGFYTISNIENLSVFLPRVDINGGNETLLMRQVFISFLMPVPAMGIRRMSGGSIERYLVESRGKLLLVRRYSGLATGDTAANHRTLHFRVFEMELVSLPNGGHSAALVELDGLDGRVIFLGKGCSRAFEAGQCKGFQGGSIYFLEDAAGPSQRFSMSVFTDRGMYCMGETKMERPGMPTPILRPCLDHALVSSLLARQESQSQANQMEFMRFVLSDHQTALPWRTTKRPRYAVGESSNSLQLYQPRDIMVRKLSKVSQAREIVTRSLLMLSGIDNEAHESNTSDTEYEIVASIWPIMQCKNGARTPPIWVLPPSADEWLLPPALDA